MDVVMHPCTYTTLSCVAINLLSVISGNFCALWQLQACKKFGAGADVYKREKRVLEEIKNRIAAHPDLPGHQYLPQIVGHTAVDRCLWTKPVTLELGMWQRDHQAVLNLCASAVTSCSDTMPLLLSRPKVLLCTLQSSSKLIPHIFQSYGRHAYQYHQSDGTAHQCMYDLPLTTVVTLLLPQSISRATH